MITLAEVIWKENKSELEEFGPDKDDETENPSPTIEVNCLMICCSHVCAPPPCACNSIAMGCW